MLISSWLRVSGLLIGIVGERARELKVRGVGGLSDVRFGAAAGDRDAIAQIRSGRARMRSNAVTRSEVQGQFAASRQVVRRPVRVMRAAVWNKQ